MKRWFKFGSVRLRLTLWNMVVLALALLGCAVIVHVTVRMLLIDSVDLDLRHEADTALAAGSMNAVSYQDHLVERRKRSLPPLVGQHTYHAVSIRENLIAVGPEASRPGGQGFHGSVKVVEPDHIFRKPPPAAASRLSGLPGLLRPTFSERHRFVMIRLMDSKGEPLAKSPGEDAFGFWQRSGAKQPGGIAKPQPRSEETSMLDRQMALAGKRERIATLMAGHQEWRVLTRPLILEGGVHGSVQVAYPLQDLQSLLRGLDRTLFILIPVALLITGLGGAFLTDRALRPVRQIAMAASEVEGADLSRRLPVTGGDEFAELAATFNSMFERLQAAFSRLEIAVEQQRRFTADASHELRTPLTTIKTNADWALRKPRPVEEYQEALGSIVEATNRTSHLIEGMLCLARSDSGQPGFALHLIPVDDVLRRACAALPKENDQAPVSLILPAAPLYVRGDADQLERLVINLVENSLRHTSAEGRICVSEHSRGDRIVITVEDTGEGIPAEHLPHVCERFYRVDAARSRPGGAGLGLSICHSIAQAHGGALDIQSSPGVGTIVTVTLPL